MWATYSNGFFSAPGSAAGPSRSAALTKGSAHVITVHSARERRGKCKELSEQVVSSNQAFQKNASCIDRLLGDAAPVTEAAPRSSSKTLASLHGLHSEFEELSAVADDIRNRHEAFISTAGSKGFGRARSSSRPKMGSSGKHRIRQSFADRAQPKMKSLARRAKEATEVSCFNKKAFTSAQRSAISRFDDVDCGKTDCHTIFNEVNGSMQRVMTKVEYYRERNELVLPLIEERFMRPVPGTGCAVVDVQKLESSSIPAGMVDPLHLGNFSARKSRLKSPTTTAGASSPDASPSARRMHDVADALVSPACFARTADSAGFGMTHVSTLASSCTSLTAELPDMLSSNAFVAAHATGLSHVSSRLTLSPSGSMESLHQRTQRHAEWGHIRDFRIATARTIRESQVASRRHDLFDSLVHKAGRKDIANRDRRMFVWMTLAMAARTMQRAWQMHVEAFSALRNISPEEEVELVSRGTSGFVQISGTNSLLSKLGWGSLPAASRHMVLAAINTAWAQEVKRRCSMHAYKSWCRALRILRFVSVLRRRARLNNYIEMIKDIIHVGWRGYQMRAAVKKYTMKVMRLQSGFRSCKYFRDHIRNKIMLPMVWEAETLILGEVVGTPAAIIEKAIETHRTSWDLNRRLAEARKMSQARFKWCIHSKPRVKKRTVDAEDSSISRSALKRPTVRRGTLHSSHPSTLHHLHPTMSLLDRNRLTLELKLNIVNGILLDNSARWLQKYEEYKKDCVIFAREWQRWRVDVMALGPTNRKAWPPLPSFPLYPYELVKVDQHVLRARVLEALKGTEAGKLL